MKILLIIMLSIFVGVLIELIYFEYYLDNFCRIKGDGIYFTKHEFSIHCNSLARKMVGK